MKDSANLLPTALDYLASDKPQAERRRRVGVGVEELGVGAGVG